MEILLFVAGTVAVLAGWWWLARKTAAEREALARALGLAPLPAGPGERRAERGFEHQQRVAAGTLGGRPAELWIRSWRRARRAGPGPSIWTVLVLPIAEGGRGDAAAGRAALAGVRPRRLVRPERRGRDGRSRVRRGLPRHDRRRLDRRGPARCRAAPRAPGVASAVRGRGRLRDAAEARGRRDRGGPRARAGPHPLGGAGVTEAGARGAAPGSLAVSGSARPEARSGGGSLRSPRLSVGRPGPRRRRLGPAAARLTRGPGPR